MSALPARAQGGAVHPGVRLYEEGRYEEAMEALRRHVEADPNAYLSGRGPAALWLGRAYERLGQSADAARAYEAALRPRLDPAVGVLPHPPLVSTYASAVADGHGDFLTLQRAYLAMLRGAARIADAHTHGDTDPEALPELERHLALVAVLGAPLSDEGAGVRGPEAASWWAWRDPLPADELNPRLTEHLRRDAVARRDYAAASAPTGLDARGLAFLRYGEPSRWHSVRMDRLPQSGLRGLGIMPGELPPNEAWVYDDLDPSALFLFVRERRREEGYREGGVNDLIPRPTRTRGTIEGAPNAPAFARAGLSLLAYAYGDLAVLHPDFAGREAAVADYANWIFENQYGIRVPEGMTSLGIVRPFGAPTRYAAGEVGGSGFRAPVALMARMVDRNTTEDERLRARRATALPADYVRDLEGRIRPAEGLAARFLDEAGRTYLKLLWTADTREEATQRDAQEEAPEHVQHARLVRLAGPEAERQLVADTVYVAAGQTLTADVPLGPDPSPLALQLDDYVVYRDVPGAGIDAGSGVWRLDAPPPLGQGTRTLELSDLVPFEVHDVVATSVLIREEFDLHALRPALPRSLGDLEALGIYFEIYDLAGRQGDYLIEYEVITRREGSLLRRQRVDATSFLSLRHLDEPRRPAAFLIDHSQWTGSDEVEVAVTLTDLASDQEVTRRMSFRARPE